VSELTKFIESTRTWADEDRLEVVELVEHLLPAHEAEIREEAERAQMEKDIESAIEAVRHANDPRLANQFIAALSLSEYDRFCWLIRTTITANYIKAHQPTENVNG